MVGAAIWGLAAAKSATIRGRVTRGSRQCSLTFEKPYLKHADLRLRLISIYVPVKPPTQTEAVRITRRCPLMMWRRGDISHASSRSCRARTQGTGRAAEPHRDHR